MEPGLVTWSTAPADGEATVADALAVAALDRMDADPTDDFFQSPPPMEAVTFAAPAARYAHVGELWVPQVDKPVPDEDDSRSAASSKRGRGGRSRSPAGKGAKYGSAAGKRRQGQRGGGGGGSSGGEDVPEKEPEKPPPPPGLVIFGGSLCAPAPGNGETGGTRPPNGFSPSTVHLLNLTKLKELINDEETLSLDSLESHNMLMTGGAGAIGVRTSRSEPRGSTPGSTRGPGSVSSARRSRASRRMTRAEKLATTGQLPHEYPEMKALLLESRPNRPTFKQTSRKPGTAPAATTGGGLTGTAGPTGVRSGATGLSGKVRPMTSPAGTRSGGSTLMLRTGAFRPATSRPRTRNGIKIEPLALPTSPISKVAGGSSEAQQTLHGVIHALRQDQLRASTPPVRIGDRAKLFPKSQAGREAKKLRENWTVPGIHEQLHPIKPPPVSISEVRKTYLDYVRSHAS